MLMATSANLLRPLSLWILAILPSIVLSAGASSTRAGQPVSANVKTAIDRGVEYLKQSAEKLNSAEAGLAAYALLTADASPQTPAVMNAVRQIQRKIKDGQYKPENHHIYEAGVDIMALEAADPKRYKPEIEAIARYLVSQQKAGGYWEYPDRQVGGDTSITQYGLLGLWSASRSGVAIPLRVWDGAASWLLRTQLKNGAFAYWPVGGKTDRARPEPRHSMSGAGVGCLLIARRHLSGGAEWTPGTRHSDEDKVFGVLETIDFENLDETEETEPVDILAEDEDYEPRIKPKNCDPGVLRGLAWLGAHFTIDGCVGAPIYFLYAMERVGALAHVDRVGNHDWYAEGADYLLKHQDKDGSWNAHWHATISTIADTSFALLFLSRSTAKHVKSMAPRPGVGTGLLSGGRGLPDDLSQAEARDGTIRSRKIDTPLDKLLSELANPANLNVETAQTQLVQNIQLGNREELIGQKDLLLKLIKDRRVEVRRTAAWALGRCEDLRLAPALIEALNDPDLDVSVEARNALCPLSRRPLVFGLPDAPAGANDAPADDATIQEWKAEAVKRWKAWYQSVRPYEERDSLSAKP